MQFEQRSPSRCSTWGAVILLAAAVVLPGDCLAVAQENPAQLGYFIESFPVDSALATLESDGHSPSEARQLLQNRFSRDPIWSDAPNNTVPSAQLQNDQLYVQGSRAYINSVKQQLLTIQEFGLKDLLYTIVVVEVPTEKVRPIVENWDLSGASSATRKKPKSGLLPNSAVVPASFTYSASTSEFRIAKALSDDQCNELVGLGKVISSPKVVRQSGAQVEVRIGSEVSFVGSYEPVKDESGNDTTNMQPKVVSIHDGIELDVTGALRDNQENVRLKFRFAHSQVKGFAPFTFESAQGPLTVQQPKLSVNENSTSCQTPANTTIALYYERIGRELLEGQKVPIIGRIPYVGKLFNTTVEAKESISIIVLMRCQEHTAESP